MTDFPISKSPFLRSQIIERDYAHGNFEAKPTESIPTPPQATSQPVKSVIKQVVPPLPPPPPPQADEVPAADPIQEFQFSDPQPDNQGFESENLGVDSGSGLTESEEEKMSAQQARDIASMVVMIFNQIVTALGYRFCTIDIESVEANVTKGNIDRHLADAVIAANERSKEKIPFSVEHQKELIKAITVILKNGNYSGISPTLMAWISIGTVCMVHGMGLLELVKSNQKIIQDAIDNSSKVRYQKEDSNIPAEVVVKEKPVQQQQPVKTQINSKNRAKVL